MRRGAAPQPFPSMGVWSGAMPPQKIFSKINVKIAYFSAFFKAEMVSSAVASRSRQD